MLRIKTNAVFLEVYSISKMVLLKGILGYSEGVEALNN